LTRLSASRPSGRSGIISLTDFRRLILQIDITKPEREYRLSLSRYHDSCKAHRVTGFMAHQLEFSVRAKQIICL
jgi:hypothetical protein